VVYTTEQKTSGSKRGFRNGRILFRDAALILRRRGEFSRCERTQREFGTSGVGSLQTFAAIAYEISAK
jgi:hypothetical protein